jgi:hypothetical protein
MMSRCIISCFLLLSALVTDAQSKTYIGVEVAYSKDVFTIVNPEEHLAKPDLNSALWGATIRHQPFKYWFLEAGLYARAYKKGIAFINGSGGSGTDRTGILIPLRVGGRLPFFKEKIALCAVAGYTQGWATESQGGWSSGGGQYPGPDQYHYEYDTQYPEQAFSLFQLGAGLDVRLWPKTLLTLSTNYYTGINKIMIQHIEYTVNNGPVIQTTSYTKGNFYTIGIGIRQQLNL